MVGIGDVGMNLKDMRKPKAAFIMESALGQPFGVFTPYEVMIIAGMSVIKE